MPWLCRPPAALTGGCAEADGTTLIVAESYGNRLTAFDIGQNGDLSGRRVWAEVGDDHPDGICIDTDGAVWYADVGNSIACAFARAGSSWGRSSWTAVLLRARSAGMMIRSSTSSANS